MSFLDNLENSLKSLESQDERGSGEHRQRESERARAMAAAPWAEKLKSSPYTRELLTCATRAGFRMRAKVYIGWIGTTLKLEARERKLELHPAADGITAVFIEAGKETGRQSVDLESNPEDLVKNWLASEAL